MRLFFISTYNIVRNYLSAQSAFSHIHTWVQCIHIQSVWDYVGAGYFDENLFKVKPNVHIFAKLLLLYVARAIKKKNIYIFQVHALIHCHDMCRCEHMQKLSLICRENDTFVKNIFSGIYGISNISEHMLVLNKTQLPIYNNVRNR